jgi:hypothetical protein
VSRVHAEGHGRPSGWHECSTGQKSLHLVEAHNTSQSMQGQTPNDVYLWAGLGICLRLIICVKYGCSETVKTFRLVVLAMSRSVEDRIDTGRCQKVGSRGHGTIVSPLGLDSLMIPSFPYQEHNVAISVKRGICGSLCVVT